MVLGIDLGTTYSAAAYLDKNGEVQMITNKEGDRTTPSVFFEESPGHVVVGEVAKENALIRPQDVISVVKNFMGSKEKFKLSSGREYTPEEVSSFIIRKIVQDAESFTGEKIREVVITVPAYFTDAQRKATEDAATIAGVKMIGVINEPTAAMLSYAHKSKIEHGNIMIYDLGGGTFDVSIVRIDGNDIKVLSTDGIDRAGGYFFDMDIVKYVTEYFLEKHNISLDDEEYLDERQELIGKAEKAKIQLSSRQSTSIVLKVGSVKESIEITRELFDGMIKKLYRRTEVKMKNALKNAGLTVDQLDTVLLVGGSSRIPSIVKGVETFIGKEAAKDINQDEAVAYGAAIYGSMHGETEKQYVFQDTTSHSIGFIFFNNDNVRENKILIPKNTSLPASMTAKAMTRVMNQAKITLDVTEGETADVAGVTIIEKLDITLPPALPKGTEVVITFEQDEYQLLHIHISIPSKEEWGFEHKMVREANLSEDEIASMTGLALQYSID